MNPYEQNCIAVMLAIAIETGLELEVVCAFANAFKSTPNIDIDEAVFEALYEWDLASVSGVAEVIKVTNGP